MKNGFPTWRGQPLLTNVLRYRSPPLGFLAATRRRFDAAFRGWKILVRLAELELPVNQSGEEW